MPANDPSGTGIQNYRQIEGSVTRGNPGCVRHLEGGLCHGAGWTALGGPRISEEVENGRYCAEARDRSAGPCRRHCGLLASSLRACGDGCVGDGGRGAPVLLWQATGRLDSHAHACDPREDREIRHSIEDALLVKTDLRGPRGTVDNQH